MTLLEAKQILKRNGYRLIKESDNKNFTEDENIIYKRPAMFSMTYNNRDVKDIYFYPLTQYKSKSAWFFKAGQILYELNSGSFKIKCSDGNWINILEEDISVIKVEDGTVWVHLNDSGYFKFTLTTWNP